LVNNHFYKEALFISNLNKYASLSLGQLTLFIQNTFPELSNSDQISDRLFNLFKGFRDVESFNQMISPLNKEQLEPFISKLESIYPQVKSKLDKVLPQNLSETQARIYIVKFYKEIDTSSFLSNLDNLQSKEDFFSLMKGIKKEKQISSIFEGKDIQGLSQLELQWIEKVFNDPNEAHSVNDILSLVRSFNRDQERFDKKITDFESYSKVQEYLDSKSGISEHAYMESIRLPAQSNEMSNIVYEDERWKVVAIGSTIAGQYWRYATRSDPNLCIGTLTNNQFTSYSIEDNLDIYFIIDKVNSGSDNPMRMFSMALERINQYPSISKDDSTMTNSLNKKISMNDIRNTLGNVYRNIHNAIMKDAESRKESLGRKNVIKLHDLIKDRESTLNNLKKIKIYLNELITNRDNVTKLLEYKIDELEVIIVQKLIDSGNEMFFDEEYRLNHKYPELEEVIAEKWANEGNELFFTYGLNKKKQYKALERVIAEKLANGDAFYFFFKYKLNEKYEDLERVIAEKWANEGRYLLFYKREFDIKYSDLEKVMAEKLIHDNNHEVFFNQKYRLNEKYEDLEKVLAEKWVNDNNYQYFFNEKYRLNEKYPELERLITEKMANDDRVLFLTSTLSEKYKDLERVIAEKWATDGNNYFFGYRLNNKEEYEDLERVIAEKWVTDGNNYFFRYELNEKYPDLEGVIAEKWATDGNNYFFRHRLNEKKEYKDLVRVIAEKWANDGDTRFCDNKYKLYNEYPELIRVIAEKWVNDDNNLFFDYELKEVFDYELNKIFDYVLNEKYPDLERVIAEKWANDGNELFFTYGLNKKYSNIVFKEG
jgi:hypothetical protein